MRPVASWIWWRQLVPGGGDGVCGGGGADTGEEDEFADFLGEVVVFFFVAKGAGHAAAT